MAKKRTDLHCHILPGIDDGARNTEVSLELLRKQKNEGVDQIVFTPHFNADHITIDKFAENRAQALERLKAEKEFSEMGISYKLGAEIYYTIDLPNMNLDELCFQGTDYVLIELPTQARPHGLRRTFGTIVSNGYTPIIAHVERYSYMLSDPSVLYELIEMGCLAHINAEALIKKTRATGMVAYFVRKGLVQFLCTDCHSPHRRPPNMDAGFDAMTSLVGEKYTELFTENAGAVFDGRRIDLDHVKKPQKLLGLWL